MRRIATLFFLSAACGSAGDRGAGQPRAAPGAEPTLRPVELSYRLAHRGDHAPWDAVVAVSIERATHGGRAVWRKTYSLEPSSGKAGLVVRGTALVEEGLAVLAIADTFGPEETRSSWRGQGVTLERTVDGARQERLSLPLPGPLSLDYGALDVVLPRLPMMPGRRVELWLLDHDPLSSRWQFRPFSLSVVARERVTVPAGTFEAFRLALTPRDGNRRLTANFHVRASRPRFLLRKEYVVNPVTAGAIKRSSGTEELASIRWR